jgi:hypothetical protein
MRNYRDGRLEPVPMAVKEPIESNGAVPVNVQDQASPPIDSLFAQSQSLFSLAADTTASTISTLYYKFTAAPGHGIISGEEIILLDEAADRSFIASVISVVVDDIEVDRPIDHVFPSATTLGRVILTNLNVDGSITPQIFSARAGQNPSDFVRFLITMTDDSSMDDSRFGGLPALTRGLVFRIVNGFQRTIFCFKTNQEIKQFCYDVEYSSRAPAGFFGLSSRITFGGQSKHGVVLRIGAGDVLQWVVQDDLTGLDTIRISAQGHEVTD